MTTSDLTIDGLAKDGNSAKVIYSEPPAYTVQFTEPTNYSNTHTQIHQPQSTYNINSLPPTINLNGNRIQSTIQTSSYKAWSILNIIFCNICFGCLALHYSNKTKDLKRNGLVQDALNTSKVARNINLVNTLMGIFALVFFFFIKFLIEMNSETVK
ncbi:unnamed protein product [Adineta steineri]|uniref:Interferon-induced transmembrane protein n=1 Tax=Adineta steineri TaxID=433720 RepID=A0A813VII3_9BILA|nr:unnamed protein product [Adineta steineri]CAF0849694.1 unnamed protein product [Adineta steineri]CAF1124033.1 unnamed protein product [Adineta steineri]CAF4069271.1 unnamed protein product [Adineta steineri]